jgi:nucleoside 2-deoxyribosyltransferase
MRVYLAGSWNHRLECRLGRTALQGIGIEVVARWLDTEHNETVPREEQALMEALYDLEDIDGADAIVVDNTVASSSGGFHLETGYALAKGKPVYLIGERTSVFHYLPGVTVVDSPLACAALLSQTSSVR